MIQTFPQIPKNIYIALCSPSYKIISSINLESLIVANSFEQQLNCESNISFKSLNDIGSPVMKFKKYLGKFLYWQFKNSFQRDEKDKSFIPKQNLRVYLLTYLVATQLTCTPHSIIRSYIFLYPILIWRPAARSAQHGAQHFEMIYSQQSKNS